MATNCKDSTATLTTSSELSTAFTNECFSGLISTSFPELEAKNLTKVYPNPTNSELILQTNTTRFSIEDRVELFSIIGKQLYSKKINSVETNIDLSSYPNGAYILVTRINGVSNSFKILKE